VVQNNSLYPKYLGNFFGVFFRGLISGIFSGVSRMGLAPGARYMTVTETYSPGREGGRGVVPITVSVYIYVSYSMLLLLYKCIAHTNR